MTANDILRKYWGHTNFRLKQEDIINQVIAGKDTLAILPTGGGKSICYQIPSLILEGICIVISPLIALMDDQVRFLSSKGIKSIAINSRMNYNQIETALNNCIYGNIKFLYIAPERLENTLIQEKIKHMNINLITVDEAHCISEWGHNFRPSYRKIAKIKELIPETPILALTATATNKVAQDIEENLKFTRSNIIKTKLSRDNVAYFVTNTNQKEEKILELINQIKSSSIVYVRTRKEAKRLSEILNKNKYNSEYYHAGIQSHKRKEIQDRWTNNETRIIVATNAFGMGIDKNDVKLIIHTYLPENIETYLQQSGRAGRNGDSAYSFILVNKKDVKIQKEIFKLKYPEIDEIRSCYQKIANYLQIAENVIPEERIAFDIIKFCKRYNISVLKVYYILQYLEKEEEIKFHTTGSEKSKIKIIITNSELYKFQIANQKYEKIIKCLLRLYENIFHYNVNINEEKIAKVANMEIDQVKHQLHKLKQIEVLEYKEGNVEINTYISLIKPRKDINNLHINKGKWEARQEIEHNKLEQISSFAFNKTECRKKILSAYFEEYVQECGICDFCIKNKKNIL